MPVASHRWALDSGGFTELHKYGEWLMPAAEYAKTVNRYIDEIGIFSSRHEPFSIFMKLSKTPRI
jgi:hypothetical protein